MRINSQNDAGIIESASTDNGIITFSPIGNDRLIINGRDVARGQYLTALGRLSGEYVSDELMAQADDLRSVVEQHNRTILDAARERHFAEREQRNAKIATALAGSRGTYTDRNSY